MIRLRPYKLNDSEYILKWIKEMISLAIRYTFDILKVKRVTSSGG